MNKKLINGVVAGVLVATGVVSFATAQTTAPAPVLTQAQAVEIALAEVPGDVQETELEREDGEQIYDIEIVTAEGVEMEVAIHADTGEILEIEAEDDGDDEDCVDYSDKG